MARMGLFATVKSTADNIISYKISQVSLETGENEYEQRLNTVHSIASQTVGAGAALAMGGAAGPVGFTMAVIGVAVNGINKLVSIRQKEETLRKQQRLETFNRNAKHPRWYGREKGTESVKILTI